MCPGDDGWTRVQGKKKPKGASSTGAEGKCEPTKTTDEKNKTSKTIGERCLREKGICVVCKVEEPHSILACSMPLGLMDPILRGYERCSYCCAQHYNDGFHWIANCPRLPPKMSFWTRIAYCLAYETNNSQTIRDMEQRHGCRSCGNLEHLQHECPSKGDRRPRREQGPKRSAQGSTQVAPREKGPSGDMGGGHGPAAQRLAPGQPVQGVGQRPPPGERQGPPQRGQGPAPRRQSTEWQDDAASNRQSPQEALHGSRSRGRGRECSAGAKDGRSPRGDNSQPPEQVPSQEGLPSPAATNAPGGARRSGRRRNKRGQSPQEPNSGAGTTPNNARQTETGAHHDRHQQGSGQLPHAPYVAAAEDYPTVKDAPWKDGNPPAIFALGYLGAESTAKDGRPAQNTRAAPGPNSHPSPPASLASSPSPGAMSEGLNPHAASEPPPSATSIVPSSPASNGLVSIEDEVVPRPVQAGPRSSAPVTEAPPTLLAFSQGLLPPLGSPPLAYRANAAPHMMQQGTYSQPLPRPLLQAGPAHMQPSVLQPLGTHGLHVSQQQPGWGMTAFQGLHQPRQQTPVWQPGLQQSGWEHPRPRGRQQGPAQADLSQSQGANLAALGENLSALGSSPTLINGYPMSGAMSFAPAPRTIEGIPGAAPDDATGRGRLGALPVVQALQDQGLEQRHLGFPPGTPRPAGNEVGGPSSAAPISPQTVLQGIRGSAPPMFPSAPQGHPATAPSPWGPGAAHFRENGSGAPVSVPGQPTFGSNLVERFLPSEARRPEEQPPQGQTINAAPPSSLPAAASSEAPSRSYKAMLKGPSAEPEEIPGAEAVVSAEDDAIELAKEASLAEAPQPPRPGNQGRPVGPTYDVRPLGRWSQPPSFEGRPGGPLPHDGPAGPSAAPPYPSNAPVALREQFQPQDPDVAKIMGLMNPTAANHCFLNAALQSLWSVPAFAEGLAQLEKRDPAEISEAVRELVLLTKCREEVKTGKEPAHVADPRPLRVALDRDHVPGEKRDVGEAILELLEALEFTASGKELLQRVFATEYEEVSICTNCAARTSHDRSNSSMLYSSGHDILDHWRESEQGQSPSLGTLLLSSNVEKSCSKCNTKNPVEFDLKRLPPKALIVQLQWQQSLATADDIKDIMQAVYRKLDLSQMFEGLAPGAHVYQLRTITSFYGAHYIVSLKPRLAKDKWLQVDDTKGSAVSSFDELTEKATIGKQLPVLLFFEQCPAVSRSDLQAQ